MKQKGRPKKYTKAKHRKKTICLNEKASVILDKLTNIRPNFNFSRYIAERIIDDFGDVDGTITMLKREIGKNNREIDLLQEENRLMVAKIQELQLKEEEIKIHLNSM